MEHKTSLEGTVTRIVTKSLKKAKELSDLGCFIYLDDVGALDRAAKFDSSNVVQGKLSGVPIAVKDNIHVAEIPNSAGTPSLKKFKPILTSPVVRKLEQAGAIVLGKTNMHELAFGVTNNNSAFGPARNAHDRDLIAGGSSGGTAVAIASGIVEMGLGTDTGGSTRIPASMNGIVGFRPTVGRYDSSCVTPLSNTRDTIGPMAKDVQSVALMDSVITSTPVAELMSSTRPIRLGLFRDYFFQGLSTEVERHMEKVLAVLADANITLVEVEMPGLKELNDSISFPVALHEFITQIPDYLKKNEIPYSLEEFISNIASPDVKSAAMSQLSDEAIPAEVYEQAIKIHRPQLKQLYQDTFESNQLDAIISPTTACVAQPIITSDEEVNINGQSLPTFSTLIKNTDPSSNAGLPSISLPSGSNESGLPIGVLLDGSEGQDRRLLSLALTLEAILNQK